MQFSLPNFGFIIILLLSIFFTSMASFVCEWHDCLQPNSLLFSLNCIKIHISHTGSYFLIMKSLLFCSNCSYCLVFVICRKYLSRLLQIKYCIQNQNTLSIISLGILDMLNCDKGLKKYEKTLSLKIFLMCLTIKINWSETFNMRVCMLVDTPVIQIRATLNCSQLLSDKLLVKTCIFSSCQLPIILTEYMVVNKQDLTRK